MANESNHTNNNNRSRVCRRLYQNDSQDEGDGEENNLPEQELRCQLAEAREKWNFDFENETPLEGDWEWEKVHEEESNIRVEEINNDANEGSGEENNSEEGFVNNNETETNTAN